MNLVFWYFFKYFLYHDYQPEAKKEHLSKVHVKQEFELDGRTSSLETYGSDVHGVVTINRNIEQQNQPIVTSSSSTIPVPAPIAASVKAGIRSPSTSSGYTSEGKPVSSPIEIYQIENNPPQVGNNNQPSNHIGIVDNNNIHYGTYTSTVPTNMFNYDSQMIENGVQIMMNGQGGQGQNGNNLLAQPDKLISVDQDQQKQNQERFNNDDNNSAVPSNNLVDQAMFLSGINS